MSGGRRWLASIISRWVARILLFGGRSLAYNTIELVQEEARVAVDASGRKLCFYCPNRLTYHRASRMLRSEPETISWLDTMQPGEVLWDIGANIGVYTIYAAVVREVRVVAFEPSAANFAVLCRNISANGIEDRVAALPVAVAADTRVDRLNMVNPAAGGASSTFGSAIGWNGEEFEPTVRQGCIGIAPRDLTALFGLVVPAHIKIDVDGLEPEIVESLASLLADERVLSVQVELSDSRPKDLEQVTRTMTNCGLQLASRMREGRVVTAPRVSGTVNCVFRRAAVTSRRATA